MAEKKCKSCTMIIPREAKICPYCRKKQGWTLAAKIFAALFIVGALSAVMNLPRQHEVADNTNDQRNQSELGNNTEAEGFAKSMTDLARETWPKSNEIWHLDLTPKKISGTDIVDYRKSVSYCKATISINRAEWFNLSETQQSNYIKICIRALHQPPMINLSKVLDYYPNSAGEVSILVDNRVVATGKYSKTKLDIVLQPKTYKPDEMGKYSAKISIVFESSGIKFEGTTNIPDSTSILFTLSRGKYGAQSKVVVHNGTFSTGVFTDRGNPLPFGEYSLSLNTINPMLEAKGIVVLPDTESLALTFSPTKL